MGKDENGGDVDIIGQFGVGFYSAFMVSDKVTVESLPTALTRPSDGNPRGPTAIPSIPATSPTGVRPSPCISRPKLRTRTPTSFLEPYRIQGIVKKYSDYIRYPIRMDMERSRLKEGSDKEYESYIENTTLNSMVPLWRKNRSEITPEEYNQFYKEKFYDFEDPARVIHSSTEGAAT